MRQILDALRIIIKDIAAVCAVLLIFCIVSITNGIFTAVGIFRHDEKRKEGEHEQR